MRSVVIAHIVVAWAFINICVALDCLGSRKRVGGSAGNI